MTDYRVDALERATQVYRVTQRTATMNAWAQGISGLIGQGLNLAVDVAVLPLYAGMWTEIRNIYGKGQITSQAVLSYIKPNLGFLAADLALDKGMGLFPVIGAPFNAAFASAFAWRLGGFFGMLSALGEETDNAMLVRSSIQLTSQLFPAEDLMHLGRILTFHNKVPDRQRFIQLIASMDGLTATEMQRRVDDAMEVLKG